MIKFVDCSVVNIEADAYVNPVNCEGFMGKGLALEFSLRFKGLAEKFKVDVDQNKVMIGTLNCYEIKNTKIINFPTKNQFKYSSKSIYIAKGLDYFVDHYKEYNIKSIAIPKLGSASGGLDFEKVVKPMIENKLSSLDLDIYVCLDTNGAEQKELEMINLLKNNFSDLKKFLKLPDSTIDNIKDRLNEIKRFYDLCEIEGIGKKTYAKIFDYFYNYKNSCR